LPAKKLGGRNPVDLRQGEYLAGSPLGDVVAGEFYADAIVRAIDAARALVSPIPVDNPVHNRFRVT
jgi:hypothetical protein